MTESPDVELPQGSPSTVAPNTPASFAPSTTEQPRTRLPLRFTGSAGEYFRIWIVNLLLSVVTLGIYSAWAKVRTKRYFYRHTWLGDASFDYLASPWPILKGRILVAVVLGAVFASQHYSPPLYAVLLVLLLVATPWVIVLSLRFNARNTAYRNVRFGFTGSVRDSYAAYLVGGAAYLFTCGICLPYLQWRLSRFVVDGFRFGNARFSFQTSLGDFFVAFLIALAISMPIFGVFTSLMVGVIALSGAMAGGGDPATKVEEMMPAFVAGYVVFYVALMLPGSYLRAKMANLFWGGIAVGDHKLESTQTMLGVLKLWLGNVIVVALTLGLAMPWAKVRSHRYWVEHLQLLTSGPLVVDADATLRGAGTVGDAASDLGDFDMDLG